MGLPLVSIFIVVMQTGELDMEDMRLICIVRPTRFDSCKLKSVYHVCAMLARKLLSVLRALSINCGFCDWHVYKTDYKALLF
jgi:hypothetical protein